MLEFLVKDFFLFKRGILIEVFNEGFRYVLLVDIKCMRGSGFILVLYM